MEIESVATACQVSSRLRRPPWPHSSGTPRSLSPDGPHCPLLPRSQSPCSSPPKDPFPNLTRGSLSCPPSTSHLQRPQGGLLNQVRAPDPTPTRQALTAPGSNQRQTPGGQGHYFFLLNKHWLNKWANDKGQKGKREATGSARFNREGRQSLLEPPAPGTSCMSFLGVTEYAPGARPQTAQCTPKCVNQWAHTPGTQSPSNSTHKHLLGTLLPGPTWAGSV